MKKIWVFCLCFYLSVSSLSAKIYTVKVTQRFGKNIRSPYLSPKGVLFYAVPKKGEFVFFLSQEANPIGRGKKLPSFNPWDDSGSQVLFYEKGWTLYSLKKKEKIKLPFTEQPFFKEKGQLVGKIGKDYYLWHKGEKKKLEISGTLLAFVPKKGFLLQEKGKVYLLEKKKKKTLGSVPQGFHFQFFSKKLQALVFQKGEQQKVFWLSTPIFQRENKWIGREGGQALFWNYRTQKKEKWLWIWEKGKVVPVFSSSSFVFLDCRARVFLLKNPKGQFCLAQVVKRKEKKGEALWSHFVSLFYDKTFLWQETERRLFWIGQAYLVYYALYGRFPKGNIWEKLKKVATPVFKEDGFLEPFEFQPKFCSVKPKKGFSLSFDCGGESGQILWKYGKQVLVTRKVGLIPRSLAVVYLGKSSRALGQHRWEEAKKWLEKSKEVAKKSKVENLAASKLEKVLSLCKKAEEAFEKREWKKVRELAKEIGKLHKKAYWGFLQRLKNVENSDRVAEKAWKAWQRKNYDLAIRLAREAKSLDPKSGKAEKLFKEYQKLAKAVEKSLERAKKALEMNDKETLFKELRFLSSPLPEREKEKVEKFKEKAVLSFAKKAREKLKKGQILFAEAFLHLAKQVDLKNEALKKLEEEILRAKKQKELKRKKKAFQQLLEKAKKALLAQDVKKAKSFAKKASKLFPKHKDLLRLQREIQKLVRQMEEKKKEKKALSLVKKAEEILSKEPLKAFALCKQAESVKKLEKVQKVREKALQEIRKQFLALLAQRKWKESENLVRQLAALEAGVAKKLEEKLKEEKRSFTLEKLWKSYEEHKKKKAYRKALSVLRKILALDPKSQKALQEQAWIFQTQKKIRGEELFKRAKKLVLQKRWTEAKRLLVEALRFYPTEEGRKLLEKVEEEQEVERVFSSVEERWKQKKYKQALEELETLLEKYPRSQKVQKKLLALRKVWKKLESEKEKKRLWKEAKEAFQRGDLYTARALALDFLEKFPGEKEMQRLLQKADSVLKQRRQEVKARHLAIRIRSNLHLLEQVEKFVDLESLRKSIETDLEAISVYASYKKSISYWKKVLKSKLAKMKRYFKYKEEMEKAYRKKDWMKAMEMGKKALEIRKDPVLELRIAEIQNLLAENEREKKLLWVLAKLKKAKGEKEVWGLIKEAKKISPRDKRVLSLEREWQRKKEKKDWQARLKKEKDELIVLLLLHFFRLSFPGEAKKLEKKVSGDELLENLSKELLEAEKLYPEKFKQYEQRMRAILVLLEAKQPKKYKKVKQLIQKELRRLKQKVEAKRMEKKKQEVENLLVELRKELSSTTANLEEIRKKIEKKQKEKGIPKELRQELIQWIALLGKLKANQKAYQTALRKDRYGQAIQLLLVRRKLLLEKGVPTKDLDQIILSMARKARGVVHPASRMYRRALEILGEKGLKAALSYLRKQKKRYILLEALEEELREVEAIGGIPEGMVYVPSGSFYFGHAWAAERRYLPGFFIDKYEVTNREFYEFVRKYKYPISKEFEKASGWLGGKVPMGRDKLPVVGVSYWDALAFAASQGKRLPTEEEWVKAARGPFDAREYPWGREYFSRPNLKRIKRVGYTAQDRSIYGVMDMAGNVSEWVEADLVKRSLRLWKGGNAIYFQAPPLCQISYRYWTLKESRSSFTGFRCVMDLEMARRYFQKKKESKKSEKKRKK